METLKFALLTGVGSFLGGASRYLVSVVAQFALRTGYPVSTFVVNAVGSLLIGIVLALWERDWLTDTERIFLATGILGGFTTFSSFSQEVLLMIRNGQFIVGFAYVVLSVVVGIALCAAGYYLAK
ncbi:MAG: fluoride efflux transporter CrcB [Thermaurantimonas sp.]